MLRLQKGGRICGTLRYVHKCHIVRSLVIVSPFFYTTVGVLLSEVFLKLFKAWKASFGANGVPELGMQGSLKVKLDELLHSISCGEMSPVLSDNSVVLQPMKPKIRQFNSSPMQ